MSQSVPLCALFHNFMDVEKSVVQMFSWTMGIYGPRLFTTHEDTGKQSGKAFNALLSPTNLTVVRDHRFPDEISSIDHLLSRLRPLTLLPLLMIWRSWVTTDLPTESHSSIWYSILKLPSRVFKRIVSPHTELLRLYAFTFTFRVLEGLFKESISMGRLSPGTFWGQKGYLPTEI